ncbi:hypothetical protein [Streptomyces sp. bgisy153]|uniref:hypothetical protein n=1 Tax=Streptomyces sp. bgisy153 TaxID=3413793 RepID=UPI003D72D64D
MPIQRTTLRAALPVALLACALSACSGGDSHVSSGEKHAAGKEGVTVSTHDPSGGERATGQVATGAVSEGDQRVTYDVVAEKVDVGTEAEAQRLVADKEAAKGLVLAVAHVRFTHKAGPPLTDSPDVNDATTIWADGKRTALLIGASDDGPGCEDPYDLGGWKQGESHTLCESYLIPANSKSVEVHWSADDTSEPFIWKFAFNG